MISKDLYFISSLGFMIIFTIIFYLLGKYAIKNDRKLQILIIVIIAVCQLIIINVIWIYNYNLSTVLKGIVSGLSGCLIGFTASISSNRKFEKIKNEAEK